MTRVYLHTFGCKVNQYDTEVLRQALEAAGVAVVDDPARSDATIVNSCAVTHVSEAKMRGFVRRIARRHPANKALIVFGCAATVDDGAIRSIPGVTSVVGGTDPEAVLRALGLPTVTADPILSRFERGARAWIKIQDGCDQHCTYCATRYARGKSWSRPAAEVLREAELFASQHAEIVLTGVHIGSYGQDVGASGSLLDLVTLLVARIPDVRFRLSSIEATQIEDGLVDLLANAPDRLAPHVHAPLQSGSDHVLGLMGRRWYTAAQYKARLEYLASRVPALGLGADVMVGFPGETEGDFCATRRLVEELPFTYLHVFPYSPRPGTPSASMRPAVGAAVKKRRSHDLRKLAERKHTAHVTARDGEAADVVLLRRVGSCYEGLTEDYLTVSIPAGSRPPARFRATLRLHNDTLWADPTAT